VTRDGSRAIGKGSFDVLVETYGRRALALAERIVGHPEDAQDVYQEAWFAVWKALPRLRRKNVPWAFIRRTFVNAALDRVRARKRGIRIATGMDPEPAVTARRASIDLSPLKPGQRAALLLFFWEGLSIREIAAELGVAEGTVKTWMHRGRALLRESLLREERVR